MLRKAVFVDRHHPSLSWPQIREGELRVACHLCDALQESPRLREGDAAYCFHCGERLYRNRPHSLAHATSFSTAALVFMGMTYVFPFITMTTGSMSTRLTLIETVAVLARETNPLVAVCVFFFTILAPLLLMTGLLYVAAPLRHGIALPGAVAACRMYQRLEPWSMIEVFLLGLIVSLLKLGHLAHVDYGMGLWALGGVVLCTAAALGGIDRQELWDRLEIAQRKAEAA